jgi:hypothetical protein
VSWNAGPRPEADHTGVQVFSLNMTFRQCRVVDVPVDGAMQCVACDEWEVPIAAVLESDNPEAVGSHSSTAVPRFVGSARPTVQPTGLSAPSSEPRTWPRCARLPIVRLGSSVRLTAHES